MRETGSRPNYISGMTIGAFKRLVLFTFPGTTITKIQYIGLEDSKSDSRRVCTEIRVFLDRPPEIESAKYFCSYWSTNKETVSIGHTREVQTIAQTTN